MKLPTLYKRASTGKIQEWVVEVRENTFRTISGAQGFKTVTSDWTVVPGKNLGRSNETTPTEQALLEAQALWDKKKKSGGYWESVEDIDQKKFIEPMLAKNLSDYKARIDPSQGLIVQIKFNGMRAIATRDGLFSRKGEKYLAVPHIEKALGPFFKMYPDAVLDGELFNLELREQLNEIAKLIRRTVHLTPRHFEDSERLVRYYVYDGYNGSIGGPSVDYYTRKKNLNLAIARIPYLEDVRDFHVKSWEGLDQVYQSFLEDKHEGAIIRIPTASYENKRSKNLLKYKPEDDAEFKILDVKEGKGNWSGKAKIVSLEMPDGRQFDSTFKGTMEDAEECLKNREEWIGKIVSIKYNGLTGLGCPQFAQFDYRNCLK